MTLLTDVAGGVEVVFFDLDGTLVDHESAADRAVDQLGTTYSHELGRLDPHDLRSTWRRLQEHWFTEYLNRRLTFAGQRHARVRDLWAYAGADVPSDDDIEAIFAAYLTAYEDAWCLFPDVTECLHRLEGLSVGVITNGDLDQQRTKLERVGLQGRFDPLVVSSQVGASKPEPEIFHAAASLADTAVERCLYIGDRLETDAKAAAHAGMSAVWLDRTHAGGDEVLGVTRVETLAELQVSSEDSVSSSGAQIGGFPLRTPGRRLGHRASLGAPGPPAAPRRSSGRSRSARPA